MPSSCGQNNNSNKNKIIIINKKVIGPVEGRVEAGHDAQQLRPKKYNNIRIKTQKRTATREAADRGRAAPREVLPPTVETGPHKTHRPAKQGRGGACPVARHPPAPPAPPRPLCTRALVPTSNRPPGRLPHLLPHVVRPAHGPRVHVVLPPPGPGPGPISKTDGAGGAGGLRARDRDTPFRPRPAAGASAGPARRRCRAASSRDGSLPGHTHTGGVCGFLSFVCCCDDVCAVRMSCMCACAFVCVRVRARSRAFVRACLRACVRACVLARALSCVCVSARAPVYTRRGPCGPPRRPPTRRRAGAAPRSRPAVCVCVCVCVRALVSAHAESHPSNCTHQTARLLVLSEKRASIGCARAHHLGVHEALPRRRRRHPLLLRVCGAVCECVCACARPRACMNARACRRRRSSSCVAYPCVSTN